MEARPNLVDAIHYATNLIQKDKTPVTSALLIVAERHNLSQTELVRLLETIDEKLNKQN